MGGTRWPLVPGDRGCGAPGDRGSDSVPSWLVQASELLERMAVAGMHRHSVFELRAQLPRCEVAPRNPCSSCKARSISVGERSGPPSTNPTSLPYERMQVIGRSSARTRREHTRKPTTATGMGRPAHAEELKRQVSAFDGASIPSISAAPDSCGAVPMSFGESSPPPLGAMPAVGSPPGVGLGGRPQSRPCRFRPGYPERWDRSECPVMRTQSGWCVRRWARGGAHPVAGRFRPSDWVADGRTLSLRGAFG